ncbi:hypothetical protein CG017_05850 (plasmid) [Burkholderia glumae]|nr:hypothetical protein CG017_05850 [Burkholderia glumae]
MRQPSSLRRWLLAFAFVAMSFGFATSVDAGQCVGRFGIRHVPSVISQQGEQLRREERAAYGWTAFVTPLSIEICHGR